MQYKHEEDFSAAVKQGTRHGMYLLYGSENYLIERWAGLLMDGLEGQSAFNLHRFDGKKLDVDAFQDAVDTLPLMAAAKGVLVNDLEWAKLSPTHQGRLLETLSDLPEDCTVVITAKAPGFDPKSAGGKKLIAAADKAGCAVLLGARNQSAQVNYLKSLAKKGGCTLSTQTARYILDICDSDMHALSSEMTKICAYTGSGEVEHAHVDAVACPKTEAKVFDLRGAILSGNTDKAMTLLDNLFYLRENPVAVLAVLTRGFVELYRARAARDNGHTQEEMMSRFGYKGREFVVRNAFSAASRLSAGQLRRSLEILESCEAALKSAPTDNRVLLEQAVVALFLATGKAS